MKSGNLLTLVVIGSSILFVAMLGLALLEVFGMLRGPDLPAPSPMA
jgi:hypothetical protein